jgi:hypothetical protein
MAEGIGPGEGRVLALNAGGRMGGEIGEYFFSTVEKDYQDSAAQPFEAY